MSDVIEYKCPSCNASMVFDSKSQHMKCPYCDTEMTVEEFQRTQKSEDTQTTGKSISNENWNSMSTGQWQNDELNGMRVYSCQSCGSEIVAEETTGATTCPFCNNKVTMKGQFSGDLKPDYIIPFKLDKKAAKENYYKHLKGKKYLPKVFKKENHVDEIKGVYIPFWLFDVDADAQITYEAEKVHSHTSGDTEYTTRERIRVCTERAFRKTVSGYNGGSSVKDSNVQIHNASYWYAMYPVWLLNTTWHGQKFTFAMNGQTGKMVGDLPIDKSKFWKSVGIRTVLIWGVLYGLKCLFLM